MRYTPISWDKIWQLNPDPSKASEGGQDDQFQPSLPQALDSSPEARGQGSGTGLWEESPEHVGSVPVGGASAGAPCSLCGRERLSSLPSHPTTLSLSLEQTSLGTPTLSA